MGTGMKILIVEDEIKTLNGIEGLIRQLGEPYHVVGKRVTAWRESNWRC